MDQTLDSTLTEIDKQYGQGTVINAGSFSSDVDVIPTGAIGVDLASGIGGIPRGRVVEIYGPESSGKTSLVWAIFGEVHRRGGLTALIDAEHAADLSWAKKFGVDERLLYICQPDDAEQALNVMEKLVRSGAFAAIATDSVAALAPRKEIEGDVGDSTVGLVARTMGQALRMMTGPVYRTNTTAIFVNQIREKVGVMFGSPETTPGGRALKFSASMRIDVRRVETIKKGNENIGTLARVKFVKNKLAAPFRVADMELLFDEGLSRTGSAIDTAIALGLMKKSGAWLMLDSERWQGREAAKAYFRDRQDALDDLIRRIYTQLGVGQLPIEIAEEAA